MLLRGICVCSILILPTHQCHRDIGHLLWLASNNSPRSWWGWQRGAGVGCLKRWLTARQLQGKRIPKDFVHMLLNLHTEIHRHRETVVQISCCWQLKHCGTTRGVSVWLKNRVSPCYIPCTYDVTHHSTRTRKHSMTREGEMKCCNHSIDLLLQMKFILCYNHLIMTVGISFPVHIWVKPTWYQRRINCHIFLWYFN